LSQDVCQSQSRSVHGTNTVIEYNRNFPTSEKKKRKNAPNTENRTIIEQNENEKFKQQNNITVQDMIR